MSKTPPHSNMDHPELLVIKSKSTTVVNTVSNTSKTESMKSSSSLRHPAMIPPSIQEELENVSDLYELMPERLELESEIKALSCSNRKSNSIKNQASSASLKVKCSRWQHRSLSLPAVHGNFILLHRERREQRHITVSNSRSVISES